MKKAILFFLFITFSFVSTLNNLQAQTLTNETFKTKEDYYEHQPQVEKGLKDWFTYSPIEGDNTTFQLRKVLQSYLLAWIMGSPNVNLVIDGKVEAKMLVDRKFEYSPDLLLAMMFAKTTYLLENENAISTDFETNLAGVKGMLVIYKKIREQTKNKKKYRSDSMEKYLEWEKEGKLEENLRKFISD